MELREDFLAHSQTTPEIYEWLLYHKKAANPSTSESGPSIDHDVVVGDICGALTASYDDRSGFTTF